MVTSMSNVNLKDVENWKETLPLWFFSREEVSLVSVNPSPEELKDIDSKKKKKISRKGPQEESSPPVLVIDSCDVCRVPQVNEGDVASLSMTFSDQVLEVLLKVLLVNNNKFSAKGIAGSFRHGMVNKRSLWLCKECTNSLTSLTDLYFQLEDLREEFNVLRRRVGHKVIVSSLSKSPETYQAWEEEVKSVEDLFPSAAFNKVLETNKKKESERVVSFKVAEIPVITAPTPPVIVKAERQDYTGEVDNEFDIVSFDDCFFEPSHYNLEKNEEDGDPKLKEMSPVVILQRIDDPCPEIDFGRKIPKKRRNELVISSAASKTQLLVKKRKLQKILCKEEASPVSNEFSDLIFISKAEIKHHVETEDSNLDSDLYHHEDNDNISCNEGLSDEEYRPTPDSHYSSTTTARSIKTNYQKSELDNTQEHACDVCSRTFKEHSNLRRHIRKVHPGHPIPSLIEKRKKDREEAPSILKKTPDHQVEHHCPLCPKTCSEHSNLRRHIRTVHPGHPIPSLRDKSSPNSKSSKTSSCEDYYDGEVNNCTEGEEVLLEGKSNYDNESKLKRRSTPEKKTKLENSSTKSDLPTQEYACDICSTKYSSQRSLLHHVRTDHPESRKKRNSNGTEDNDETEYSNSSSSSESESDFSSDEDYSSNESKDKNKSNPRSRGRRSKTKSEPQEYPCSLCPKTYTAHSNLRRHIRGEHPGSTIPSLRDKNNPGGLPRSYPCPHCSESFPYRCYLKRHVNSYHSESLQCTHCDMKLSNIFALRAHKIRIHVLGSTAAGDTQCNLCLKFFSHDRNLRRHKRYAHLKTSSSELTPEPEGKVQEKHLNIYCSVCSVKTFYETEEDLKTHEASVEHQDVVKSKANVHCNACRVSFGVDVDALQEHLKSEGHLLEVALLGEFDPKSFCVPCRQPCSDKHGLAKHSYTALHQKSVAFRAPHNSKTKDANGGSQVALEVPEKCLYCGQTFSFEGELESHMERVHKDRSCEFCGKTFTLWSDLQSHRKSSHNIDLPFICDKCGKHFETEKYLRNHINLNHESQTAAMCSQCGKVLPSIKKLNRHEKFIHGGYLCSCTYCPLTFKKSNQLRRHLYRKHSNEYTKDSPFVCLVCFHIFPTAEALNDVHMATHAHLRCTLCPKIFEQKSQLVRHLRVHTGERPFNCSFCDKTFANEANLKVHELGHVGKKPHECEYCGDMFARKAFLLKHQESCSLNAFS